MEQIKNILQYIEVVLIILFIGRQFFLFANNRIRITHLKNIFPAKNPEILTAFVPKSKISNLQKDGLAREILSISKDESGQIQLFVDNSSQELLDAKLLSLNRIFHSTFQKIINSLNIYIIKNKSRQLDFNLVKDLIDRECDNKDNEIYSELQLPLYWGLLGTILGIIIGLAGLLIPSINQNDSLDLNAFFGDGQVNYLLFSVAVAMLGSFTGLLFTINNTLAYKKAVTTLNDGKNHFYSFLQTELLSVLPNSFEGTIDKLQLTLEHFNTNLEENLIVFQSSISDVQNSLLVQKALLDSISNIDINKIIHGNIKVFHEIDKSARHFKEFVSYQEQLGITIGKVNKSAALLGNSTIILNDIIKNVSFLKDNTDRITQVIEEQQDTFQKIGSLLNNETEIIAEWKRKIRHEVSSLDKVLQNNIEDLSIHSQSQLQQAHRLVETQYNNLHKIFENGDVRFDNFKFLKHLEKIDQIRDLIQEGNENRINEFGKIISENLNRKSDIQNEIFQYLEHLELLEEIKELLTTQSRKSAPIIDNQDESQTKNLGNQLNGFLENLKEEVALHFSQLKILNPELLFSKLEQINFSIEKANSSKVALEKLDTEFELLKAGVINNKQQIEEIHIKKSMQSNRNRILSFFSNGKKKG